MTAKLIITSDREKISLVIKLIGTSAIISSDVYINIIEFDPDLTETLT